HLDSLRAKTGPVPRRRRKKSEAAAVFAWILVGAVTFVGMAFLMRPELFGRILTHSPQAVSQNTQLSPNAPEPLKEIEAKNQPAATKLAASTSANATEPPAVAIRKGRDSSNSSDVDTAKDRSARATSAASPTQSSGSDSANSEGGSASRNRFSLA